MKKLILLIISGCFLFASLKSQNILLTFTAIDSAAWVQLDSIKVMNRTQIGDTVLYWPDTTLLLSLVGLPEGLLSNTGFQITRAYPNPMIEHAVITLCIPEKDRVDILVTDQLGRMILQTNRTLDQGMHRFRLSAGNAGLCFVTAVWQNQTSSIKILSSGRKNENKPAIQYEGKETDAGDRKSMPAMQGFIFSPGDVLLYIGYHDTLQSGMLDQPQESGDYPFQFGYNMPCPEAPTVEYEGQTYQTVQIMSQCWLKQNLNVGTMILGEEEMSDNDILEKYCYDDDPDTCDKYGGLYQWQEMMQYTTSPGVQGICPPGWHIPTNEEWKVLEGAVDSQYGVGDNIWDDTGWRGTDAGMNLKTTSGWNYEGNGNDMFGFSGMPTGDRNPNGYFTYIRLVSPWWSSSGSGMLEAWARYLDASYPDAGRFDFSRKSGFGVRCVKDE